MNEAGYTRGGDDLYTSTNEGRFGREIAVTEGNPTEGTVMLDGLRRVGIDANLRVIPRAQTAEPYVFAHFPGISTGMYSDATRPPLFRYLASELPRPETRAIGSNYSGFNRPGFERLVVSYETTLSRPERSRYAVQMLGLLSEEVPGYPLYHQLLVVAHSSAVGGPMGTVSRPTAGWNLHEWYWT